MLAQKLPTHPWRGAHPSTLRRKVKKAAKRVCLRCLCLFHSEHSGNRMCRSCTTFAKGVSPLA